jgi:hypothetical protein
MIYSGRPFSLTEIETIRRWIADNPALHRTALSQKICREMGWLKPNGELREMSCRVALQRMQADGLIELPLSRRATQPRARPQLLPTPATDPQSAICEPVHALPPLSLQIVTAGPHSRRWNEYIARYHYLGYTPLAGAQMRYNIFAGQQLVALISFGASAWKLASRDGFIGWDQDQRKRHLQLVVNNARFLILPWIQSKGLASKILATVSRQLPHDWQTRYGYRPVLLETFVESPRHKGTCYKAANWVNVGKTVGRGKKSRVHQQIIPIKDVWLYPLQRDFRNRLHAESPHTG